MPLPWVPAAIRRDLLGDLVFSELVDGRVSTRLPADVTAPCCTVQLVGTVPVGGAVAWLPMVQVDAWCAPATGGVDPEQVVWRIATEAARVLGDSRPRLFESMRYKLRLTDGPMPGTDLSRSAANPLYRCLIRAELTAGSLP